MLEVQLCTYLTVKPIDYIISEDQVIQQTEWQIVTEVAQSHCSTLYGIVELRRTDLTGSGDYKQACSGSNSFY